METFAIKKKEAELQKPVIVQKAPESILGTEIPALDRRTQYVDPLVFGNEGNDNHLRLLFTEIAEQDSISDIIIIPGYPVLVKKKRRGLKAITYRIMQRHECEYLARKLTGNNTFLINISEGKCLSGQAKMLDGNIVNDEDYEKQAKQFAESKRRRFRYEITGCASAIHENSFSVILRPLADEPTPYYKLGMSKEFVLDCIIPSGIVIISGATGEGKSTTLAAIYRYILEEDTLIKGILLTHEDPIEINYDKVKSKHSAVIQSSIGPGQNILTFHDANRSAMRRSPDAIMVGELRDYSTVDAAIELSNTGHPAYATTHASNVPAILPRLISLFPESIQQQKALELADTIRMLISQKLIEDVNGNMFAVRESLKFTPALRDYLKKKAKNPDDMVRKIKMIVRHGKFGSVSFEAQGKQLLAEGKINLASYRHLVEESEELSKEEIEELDSY